MFPYMQLFPFLGEVKSMLTQTIGTKLNPVADPGGLWGVQSHTPFGSLSSMKNTNLNVYFRSKVPFRETTNPRSNPPSQNPGSAPEPFPQRKLVETEKHLTPTSLPPQDLL